MPHLVQNSVRLSIKGEELIGSLFKGVKEAPEQDVSLQKKKNWDQHQNNSIEKKKKKGLNDNLATPTISRNHFVFSTDAQAENQNKRHNGGHLYCSSWHQK